MKKSIKISKHTRKVETVVMVDVEVVSLELSTTQAKLLMCMLGNMNHNKAKEHLKGSLDYWTNLEHELAPFLNGCVLIDELVAPLYNSIKETLELEM
jgi:hypothetical protein